MRSYLMLAPAAALLLALGPAAPVAAETVKPVVVAQTTSPAEANRRGDAAYDRKDYAEAMRWYRQAAAAGYALGEANVGYLYSQGLGVPQNDTEAVRWYRMAAEKGQREAQYNLGIRYAAGRGVPKDLTQARGWMEKSAANGDAKAQQWLKAH
jgi:TPR repeat protein